MVCVQQITAQTQESLADTTCDDLWFSILAFYCSNGIGVPSERMDISLGSDIPHLATIKMVFNTQLSKFNLTLKVSDIG